MNMSNGLWRDGFSLSAIPRKQRGRVAESVIKEIVRSYDSLLIRSYARIRFTILRQPFLKEIGQYLPRRGSILDLGCGFALFSLYYAALEHRREFTGIDVDLERIKHAKNSAERLGLRNVRFEVEDVVRWDGKERFDAVYMLDLLHHLPVADVPPFLHKIRGLLNPGGRIIVKDVAPTPRYKMLFTLILDRLMVGLEPIRYWPPDEVEELLESIGFSVHSHRLNDLLPYPHILYVAERRDDVRA